MAAGIAAGVAFAADGSLGATAACSGFLLFFAGFTDKSFAAEADLVALDRENFH